MTDEQKQALVDKRFEEAFQAAEEAFWNTVTSAYPEIESGDLSPEMTIGLEHRMKDTMAYWLCANRPKGTKGRDFVPVIDVYLMFETEGE